MQQWLCECKGGGCVWGGSTAAQCTSPSHCQCKGVRGGGASPVPNPTHCQCSGNLCPTASAPIRVTASKPGIATSDRGHRDPSHCPSAGKQAPGYAHGAGVHSIVWPIDHVRVTASAGLLHAVAHVQCRRTADPAMQAHRRVMCSRCGQKDAPHAGAL